MPYASRGGGDPGQRLRLEGVGEPSELSVMTPSSLVLPANLAGDGERQSEAGGAERDDGAGRQPEDQELEGVSHPLLPALIA